MRQPLDLRQDEDDGEEGNGMDLTLPDSHLALSGLSSFSTISSPTLLLRSGSSPLDSTMPAVHLRTGRLTDSITLQRT